MGLSTAMLYAELNAINSAKKRLQNCTDYELKQFSKRPNLTEFMMENLFLGIPYSDKDIERKYSRMVARQRLKEKPNILRVA